LKIASVGGIVTNNSSIPPVVYRRDHFLFTLFVFVCV